MPNRLSYNFIGIVSSIVIYLLIMVGITLYLQERVTKKINYSSQKKTLLNITLVERKKVAPKKQKKKRAKKKVVKKEKINKRPKVKKRVQKATKKRVSLQGLFEKIDTKKIPEPKEKRVQKSRKKVVVKKEVKKESTKAKELVENLKLENQQLIVSAKDGIFDEFRGKVTEILDKNWQKTVDTVSGNVAKVIIYVDKNGNFSYKIVTLSYNDAFNAKLMDFLESMKEEEFPPFTEGDVFKMKVEFKDLME